MRILSALRGLLELLYVPRCAACDERTVAPICDACTISLVELGSACPICAEPLEGPRSFQCGRCRARTPPYASITAPYRYGGQLAVALQHLKFHRRADIARTLAPLVQPALRETIDAHGIDLAVPVPLHWRRMSARGFNQAALLLRYAAAGGPLVPTDHLSLRRTRATPAQMGLDAKARAANVRGAFTVVRRRAQRIRGKRVLLVDDVVTTGATVAAAARALKAAGASQVHGFCVARAET